VKEYQVEGRAVLFRDEKPDRETPGRVVRADRNRLVKYLWIDILCDEPNRSYVVSLPHDHVRLMLL
jgi:hypothetical protein